MWGLSLCVLEVQSRFCLLFSTLEDMKSHTNILLISLYWAPRSSLKYRCLSLDTDLLDQNGGVQMSVCLRSTTDDFDIYPRSRSLWVLLLTQ